MVWLTRSALGKGAERRSFQFNNFRAVSLTWRVCKWLDLVGKHQSGPPRLRKSLAKTSYEDNRWIPPQLSSRWSKWTLDVLKFMRHPHPEEVWIKTEAGEIQALFKSSRTRMRDAGGCASDRITRLYNSGPRGRGEALRKLGSESASADLASVRGPGGRIIRPEDLC